jgi:hypothetical protein
MAQIGIDTVLAKLNDTVDINNSDVKVFGIRFINSEGETREINCRKYTKSPKQNMDGKDVRGKDFYNLQRNGVIMLCDVDAGHPRAVKTAMLYGFCDFQSTTWLNIFH